MPDGINTGIGASVTRVEDYRFLTGQGTYTDDINRPGQAYAYILRSPHAHARINGIDTTAAGAADGVVAIYTGADMQTGGLPCGWLIHSRDGSPMHEPPHPPLAQGKVRCLGDQVAIVIADSLSQAKAAAELIEVDYDVLPAVVDMKAAAGGGTLVHDDIGTNVCYDWVIGEEGDVDAALAGSAHVTEIDIVNNRLIANAMEPRAAVSDFDRATGEYTLYTTTQNPHVIRLLMGAFVLSIPEHKLRIVAPDVGGGFGSKIFHYAEEAILTWAAGKLARPIKWTAERSESFMTDAQGRDHVTTAKLGLDANGKFTALKVETMANMGAYLSTFASSVPTYLYATLLAGCYTTPVIFANVKAIFTNTVPVDAYRGAGRPEATYLLERIVNKAAKEMNLDPVEIRTRNFIPSDAFPYQTPVALQYDSGDYMATLKRAQELHDTAGFAARRAEAEARGKKLGLGYSTYLEACGIAPSAVAGALGARAGLYESAEVRVHPTGSVTIFTGTHSHGQGHETTFAQLVSERLGVPLENIEISHGDTNRVQFGMGTYGSRSLAVGGVALDKALDKIEAKAKKIAAHILEASTEDLEFNDGNFTVAGTDKAMAFGEVALAAYVPHNYPIDEIEPGLDEQAFYDPANFTYPGGCHICEVEIDPATGVTEVTKFTAVDDVGRVINPMIVAGQVHGGVAQGIGQALLEEAIYDPEGQLLTGSYMDYCMPRADNLPSIQVAHETTLCTHNSLGVKGCGEVGAIGSPPAVINAVLDALTDFGVEDIAMPATPARVWQAIQDAKA
ncbi:MAG: xanthine dehydrogenase family protein molybdopterin-binding subunit [Pseudomonadota bacterium]|jgi:carbon-monoxide dehydrogenase large subunit|nr:carbon monoxide dehydrogenase [Nisaea sp.]MEC8027976.1 xanthine dehydrogenase family protein molybdopterin-binding subunit [Pseudomonadota bacterium]MEC8055194.1 xanthine dehydrogenase family protein molybdopterin-binding subunit [Pseudomonadota bacterium]MEC8061223.1 xanthine dehydrogenase family protein molybdopterin-binding subunit [Pseudomonadota bacterium]MEC8116125.1 xanthine dehydrogenase family protein molybdopterin-binding subunit [Pseudomonadota bacterium]